MDTHTLTDADAATDRPAACAPDAVVLSESQREGRKGARADREFGMEADEREGYLLF